MVRFVIFFLLLFQSYILFAEEYTIYLNDVKVKSILEGFHVDNIINATGESSCIGFVHSGIFNKKRSACLKPDIVSALKPILVSAFPKSSETRPIIVRINQLNIFDYTWATKEIAFVNLSMSFLTPTSTGYQELFTAGDFYGRQGMEVIGTHSVNIADAISHCFDDFAQEIGKGEIIPKQISDAELYLNPLSDPGQFAIFRQQQIPKGLFKSFYDLRDCRPDTVTAFTIKYVVDKKYPERVRAEISVPSQNDTPEYFGFSDGKNLFVWAGKGYAVTVRQQNALVLYLDKKDIDKGASGSAVVLGGIMGGAVGGLLGAVAISAVYKGTKFPNNSGDIGKSVVYLGSGGILPAVLPEELKPESRTVIFHSKASAINSALKVVYETDTLCTLLPGQYLKLSLPSSFKDFDLILTCKEGVVHSRSIHPEVYNTILFLCKSRKNGAISLTEPTDQLYDDILEAMQGSNTTVITKLRENN